MQGPALQDFVVAIFFGFGFLAAHWFLDRLVFRRLAIRVLRNGSTPLKITDKIIPKIAKISESLSKFTYYTTVEMYALRIMYSKHWLTDRKEYFRGWPDQELEPPLKLYYMCQCGFYLYSIAVLLKWETRRKDFAVMLSHHVITVILIGYSYLTGFFRIGFIILTLHDASDIFMEAAKAFKYSGDDVGASVFFGLFALSWLILRLIIFPFWVIRASSYDIIEALPLSETYVFLLYYIFNTLLLMLLVFHIYWWVLIFRMIKKQLENRGKVGEDIRSGIVSEEKVELKHLEIEFCQAARQKDSDED